MSNLQGDEALTPAFLCNLFTEEIYRIKEENKVEPPPVKPAEIIEETIEPEPIVVAEPEIVYVVEEPAEAKTKAIDFIGGFQKKLAVVVTDMEEVLNNGNEKSLLGNILAAVKMNYNDVAIINLSKNPQLTLDQLLSELAAEIVLGFGLPGEFTTDYQVNTPFYYSNSIVVFYPCSLKEISKSNDLKRPLWKHLQGIFKIGT